MKERTDEAIIRAWEASKNLRIWLRVAQMDGEFTPLEIQTLRELEEHAYRAGHILNSEFIRRLSK